MNGLFDHEKLTVYQDSIRFVVWAGELLETLPKSLAAYDQLDRASTSIPLNIAREMENTQPRIDAGSLT